MRLTFPSVEIYKYLEPLYNDLRKLRYMNTQGRKFLLRILIITYHCNCEHISHKLLGFELVHMDEFIDNLIRQERYCDIQLPRLQVFNVIV